MSFMMDELLYAPKALEKVLTTNLAVARSIAQRIKKENISFISTVARGTSNNAAAFFKYICQLKTGFTVSQFDISIATKHKAPIEAKGSLFIGISQSGKSTDTIKAMEKAKEGGGILVAITNDEESELAKLADYHMYLNCGEEKSVAATKTFTLQIANLSLLTMIIAQNEQPDFDEVSKDMTMFTHYFLGIKELADKTKDLNNFIILSRGETMSIANEMSLKLMETSYKLSKCYSVAEFAHGPYAWVEKGATVIMLAPQGKFQEDFATMAVKLRKDGAKVIVFTDVKQIYNCLADDGILIPHKKESQIFLFTIAAQAYAAYLSKACGKNPDSPRGLKKVTLTI